MLPDQGKGREGWFSTAIKSLIDLPAKHRPAAFIATLLTAVVISIAATLVAKNGKEFLVGSPIIAFAVFMLATLALLSYIRPDSSAGLIGLFYFLPLLYAVLVFGLAFLNRNNGIDPSVGPTIQDTKKQVDNTKTTVDETKHTVDAIHGDVATLIAKIAQLSDNKKEISTSEKGLEGLSKKDEVKEDIKQLAHITKSPPLVNQLPQFIVDADSVTISGTVETLAGEPFLNLQHGMVTVLYTNSGAVQHYPIDAATGTFRLSVIRGSPVNLLFTATDIETKMLQGISSQHDQTLSVALP